MRYVGPIFILGITVGCGIAVGLGVLPVWKAFAVAALLSLSNAIGYVEGVGRGWTLCEENRLADYVGASDPIDYLRRARPYPFSKKVRKTRLPHGPN